MEELTASARAAGETSYTVNVPILLYHHLSYIEPESGTSLRPDTFAHQMDLLEEHGYTPVDFDDLIAYVEQGVPLPDQRWSSPLTTGISATMSTRSPSFRNMATPPPFSPLAVPSGTNEYYKDTQYALTPHFGKAEIDEMLTSGLISIESHTYDMHQWAPFEPEGAKVRGNLLPLESDTEASYIAAVTEDARLLAETFFLPRHPGQQCPGLPQRSGTLR